MPLDTFVIQELGLYARRLCSGIFLSRRKQNEVIRNSFAPQALVPLLKVHVNKKLRRVTVTYKGVSRTAQFADEQGSIVLPKGSDHLFFTPVRVLPQLPPPTAVEWPMGDAEPKVPQATGLDAGAVEQAIKKACIDPSTVAVVVVHKGVIVGEYYADGYHREMQLESWSMGKSLLATVFALLVADGTYTLDQRVPVPGWRKPGDPRGNIRIQDLLRMSSGLRCTSSFDTGYGPKQGYSQHMRGYCEAMDIHKFARERKLETPKPGGRYRNCDCWVLGWLIKDALRRRGEEYLTFPQRALFDQIGIRKQVLETDPYGNMLFSGCDYGTPRNWARLGLLYLQNGVWNGKQILPKGWVEFVTTPAKKWPVEEYGGLFWLNRAGSFEMFPADTYAAAGAGGQFMIVVPAHDLVVVRMGHATELTAIHPMPPGPPPTIRPGSALGAMLLRIKEALPKA